MAKDDFDDDLSIPDEQKIPRDQDDVDEDEWRRAPEPLDDEELEEEDDDALISTGVGRRNRDS